MGMAANFWVFRIGRTLVSAHTSVSPTDEQWNQYLDLGRKMSDEIGFTALRGISFTDGGAPTSTQRERANDFLQGRSAPTSIVSTSPMVRGVVTALGWFNSQIRVFAPHRVRDALAHIGFTSGDMPTLCQELRRVADFVEAARRTLEELEAPATRAPRQI